MSFFFGSGIFIGDMRKTKKKKKWDKKNNDEENIKEAILSPETKNSIFAILFFCATALFLFSLFDRAGVAGQWVKKDAVFLFGKVAFIIPLVFLLAGISFLAHIQKSYWKFAIGGMCMFFVSVLGMFELFGNESRSAGFIGYYIALPVLSFLSWQVGVALFGTVFLMSILLIFDASLATFVKPLAFLFQKEAMELEHADESEWRVDELPNSERRQKARERETVKEEEKEEKGKDGDEVKKDEEYEPPPFSLLDQDGSLPSSGDIQANKNIIARTLEEFGIEVEMAEVSVGPTVTQYTLKPAQGVNVTRITALSRNLSLALAAHPIRIEAPIPGKGLVGIEIPNKQAAIVRVRSLLQGLVNKKLPSSLVLALGRDVAGEPVIAYLDKMPHLLVSGSTGSGKSICLNAIITALVYLNSPRNLRFLLIDPKRVEFSMYEGIPHLLTPVIVDMKKAISVLRWSIAEMERRYKVLESANVRDIKGYNDSVKKKGDEKPLPYLVIIIDEMADLMMKNKREVETSIVRIAQMARAVGIHLITSTQRPSTDVVTGLIKANIMARIAFKMPTQIDSRTILDQAGAEKLLGHGDMLFMSGQSHGAKRVQGTYISEKEVKKVVQYLADLKWENEDDDVSIQAEERKEGYFSSNFDSEDDLYVEARSIAMETGKVSASLLQRKLQVGYARAARLLDMMEEEGIIGPAQGAKPREVIK